MQPAGLPTTLPFMIRVSHVSGDDYEVQVTGHPETVHRVTLCEPDRKRLCDGDVSAEALIEESFSFLLEREANTSILRKFDLPLISQYFPEYESEIRMRTKQ